jgi:hypothetical protein
LTNETKFRLTQAQAVLDLFEKDCGRPAATMNEVHHWAFAQNRAQLERRVKHRLIELLYGYPKVPQRNAAGVSSLARGG